MTEKVLIVDDDPAILQALERNLRRIFDIHTAEGGEDALKMADSEGPFAVVMCDMTMPVINGAEVLNRFKEKSPDTVRMMLTGNADQRTAVEAVNRGQIFRFFNKPCSADEIAEGVKQGLRQYRLVCAERELLEKTLAGSVKVLIDVLSMVDPSSFGNAAAIRDWARAIAPKLGLAQTWHLDLAAMLAPIGRVAIPQEILKKAASNGALLPEERAMIERVPEIGRDLIANIPRMCEVADIVYYANKGFDGSGFPDDGVSGTEIPLESRAIKVLGDLANICGRDNPRSVHIGMLNKSPNLYCPEIMRIVMDWIGESETENEGAGGGTFSIPVQLLQPGYVLMEDLRTPNGHLVLSAGSRVSEVQVERLRNFQEAWKFEGNLRVTK